MKYKVNGLLIISKEMKLFFRYFCGPIADTSMTSRHLNPLSGNEAAFEELFNTYFKALSVFAKKLVDDLEVAQDLVQDVFVKLYENRDEIEFQVSIKAFLYQSVRNKCIDHIRSQKTRTHHHEEIFKRAQGDDIDTTDLMLQTELEQRIHGCIAELPEQCQLIFRMNRFEGKKNQEIAEELGISKRTVETQISKALKRLRTQIHDYIKLLILLSINLFQ